MKNESMQTHFKKGVTTLCILSLLRQGDMYGYELVQAMAQASGGCFTLQEGTLYPVLYRLQEAGYISDRRVPVGKRMTRVYYHMEPAGMVYLEHILTEYEAISTGVQRILEYAKEESPHEQTADLPVSTPGCQSSTHFSQRQDDIPNQSGAADRPLPFLAPGS